MSAPTKRRGSVYLAIMVVVAAVTTLVLTGVSLRIHLHERAQRGTDTGAVRRLATSAAELAVHAASADAAVFKQTAGSGVLFQDLPLNPGVISATVTDADTKATVASATTNYLVIARGDAGDSTARISLLLETPDDDLSLFMAQTPEAVAYWPLDDVNTTVATEKIAARHGIYAVANAAGAYTHAHAGPAPRMTWFTELVRVPHHTNFELANGTLFFWVRFDLKPTINGVQMGALSKEKSPRDGAMNLAVFLTRDDLSFVLNNAANQGRTISTPSSHIVQGQWHFVAVTWGDDGMHLFLDGVLRAESDTEFSLQAQRSRAANRHDWYFGVRNIPFSIYSQSSPVFGSVARVGLLNTQIDESQVQAIYNTTTMPPGIRLVPGSFATVVD